MSVFLFSRRKPGSASGRRKARKVPAADAARVTFDAVGDAVWVLGVDQRILQCNRAALELFGKPLSAVEGRPCWEVAHGATGPLAGCPVARMRISGRREFMELVFSSRCFQVTVDPVIGPAGKLEGIIHILRDVTDRKRIEQELLDLNQKLELRVDARTAELRQALEAVEQARQAAELSEAKFRGLAENTKDILYSTDANGVFTYVGPQCRAYGWRKEDIVGAQLLEIVAKEDRALIAGEFEHALATGTVRTVEFRVRNRKGRVYWFEEAGTLQRDAAGRVSGMIGVLRDISERKKADRLHLRQEQRLHHLTVRLATAYDDEQRRIAAGLHDEVAQLLAAANMKLALARGGDKPAESAKSCDEADRLVRSANEKIRSLCFELASPASCQLGLEDALRELCEMMGERHGLRFTLQGDLGGLRLDESIATTLFKAVREMLFNVVKHAAVKEASVSLVRDGKWVRVTVEDHGKGFPAGFSKEKIGRGTGLGVFAVRQRVENLGGGLTIESQPGVCTRVTLSVPAGKRTTR